jgi:hypothetical protein
MSLIWFVYKELKMTALVLNRSDLVDGLQQAAKVENVPTEELLNQAVAEFLDKMEIRILEAENEAFTQLHPQLVNTYLGEYVAIHNGEVVDHDSDARSLHIRIRRKYGKAPVLIREVTQNSDLPQLVWHHYGLEA